MKKFLNILFMTFAVLIAFTACGDNADLSQNNEKKKIDIQKCVSNMAKSDESDMFAVRESLQTLSTVLADDSYTEEEHNYAEFCRDYFYITVSYLNSTGSPFKAKDAQELADWGVLTEDFVAYAKRGTKISELEDKLEYIRKIYERRKNETESSK